MRFFYLAVVCGVYSLNLGLLSTARAASEQAGDSKTVAGAAGLDIPKLESTLGMKGTVFSGEFKISIPQKDLNVTVDGFRIVPAMGLTSWIAFTPHMDHAMIMGDLVLLEDEVAAVQKVIIAEKLSITALHNHFLRDAPKVMFMHVGGMNETEALAKSIRKVLDRIRDLRAAKKMRDNPSAVESSLDTKAIDAILGQTGKMQDGVYKFVLGRPDVQLTDQAPVSAFMGFNTWLAFQGAPEKAAVSGDFAMLEEEVKPVIQELVAHGIEVTAIHNHMVSEDPRIIFLHFWGVGPAADLAKGLKAALDKTKK